ncbi:adaptor protein MecA [Anaerocolumna sp. AGMB13025]|uniref:adaptor protein MecA n=1 Tax=Anaerocolumna sp. AGMB13025 TaxID=3039116 RepID=UPI00241C9E90|nr:adaptor protein MecA [Anaerocolumna sp. AGMB13025]WFR57743.1 adaptor protein MecA [Anaerocolumna sp. AGMB13025]
MKIEKISERQIRCTLSRDDLVDRELRISELAYGSEKAKALFRDMMQQANYEFGFEAEDIPLMIEAIPVSPECLILVITKVEDPDELDTRFSKFSPDSDEHEDIYDDEADDSYADEIINVFGQMDDLIGESGEDEKEDFVPLAEALSINKDESQEEEQDNKKSVSYQTNLMKVYSFKTLNEVSKLSEVISTYYKGNNSLYKNPVNSMYYLIITKSDHSPEEFNKICNIISEYGRPERTTYASPFYYEEHFEALIKNNAVQVLAAL